MKKHILFICFLITSNLFAQNDGIEICFQYQKSLKEFTTNKKADEALNKILDVIGASKNFSLIRCDQINNALAVTYKGERYILYDSDFFKMLEELSNDWSSLFILSHEVGHHINGHTRDFLITNVLEDISLDQSRTEELEADEFAGFILANLGAKFQDIEELIDLISVRGEDSFSTHPNRDKRLLSAKKGFDRFDSKIESVKKPNNYYRPEIVRSGNWESYVNHSNREETIKRLKESKNNYDPFQIELKASQVPIKTKSIYADGFSYDGKEKISLAISFSKWDNEWGMMDQLINDMGIEKAQKEFAGFEIKNSLSSYLALNDYEGAPKFTYDKELVEEFPELKLEYRKGYSYYSKLSYMIDDNIKGHFFTEMKGWVMDWGKNKPKPETHLPIRLGFFYDGDTYENLYNNFLKFIDGLKSGNTLYMKIENIGFENNSNASQSINRLIKPTTYVFDLKGSTKAIGQYKGGDFN